MEYVIETQNLSKQYRTKLAVNGVSMHVKRGDIYGLIGKNGAGKTSLMKLILGLSNPTKGKVVLFGQNNFNTARKKIGSLIEAPGLYKNCTAYENMLRFSFLSAGGAGQTGKKEIDSLLSLVGLANTGKKKAGEFSLGMRQRLGIAIALLGKPEILVLDEPINGLDPAGIKEIRDLILKLNQNHGVTFVISSHLLDELAKVVSCYGIMNEGCLVEEIDAKELESRGHQYLKIICRNMPKALVMIRAQFPHIQAAQKADGLYLYSHLDHAAEINACLVGAGIPVAEITMIKNGFEEFFIEKLGRVSI